jgi:hypothetical protein
VIDFEKCIFASAIYYWLVLALSPITEIVPKLAFKLLNILKLSIKSEYYFEINKNT